MPTQLELLTPGITQMFSSLGYKVYVTGVTECEVTLVKNGVTVSKAFPWPQVNRDLSSSLTEWRNQLTEAK